MIRAYLLEGGALFVLGRHMHKVYGMNVAIITKMFIFSDRDCVHTGSFSFSFLFPSFIPFFSLLCWCILLYFVIVVSLYLYKSLIPRQRREIHWNWNWISTSFLWPFKKRDNMYDNTVNSEWAIRRILKSCLYLKLFFPECPICIYCNVWSKNFLNIEWSFQQKLHLNLCSKWSQLWFVGLNLSVFRDQMDLKYDTL